jgi:membrane fusion protein, multidrug efflux system
MKSILITASALLCFTAACSSTDESAESTIPVSITVAAPGVISSTVMAGCRLESGSEAVITPLNPGRILEVPVSEGDTVQMGDVLVELSSDQQYSSAVYASSAQLMAARTLAANAETDLLRAARLRADGALSESEYEMAVSASAASQATVEQALAGYHSARMMEESGKILAPFDGTVTRVWANEGSISSGPLVSITDSGILTSELLLADRHLQFMTEGLPVIFTTSHYPGELFTGDVVSFSSSVDPVSGLVSVIVQFHDGSNRLRSGMTGTATIGLETSESAIVLPLLALLHRSEYTWEAALIRNGAARIVSVETGIMNGTMIEVTEGIEPGDSVILLGNDLVIEGSIVRVVR